MASKDFEVRQLFKAYRSGLISEELFTRQMDDMCKAGNGQGGRTRSPTRPAGLRGVTGDAGLDAPGGMARPALEHPAGLARHAGVPG